MADTRLCSIEGCGKRVKSRGHCSMHAARRRIHGDPLADTRRRTVQGECAVEGCSSPASSSRKMLCGAHYKRAWRYGDPEGGKRRLYANAGEPARWLEDHVSYDGEGCLEWPFADRGNGYGVVLCSGASSYTGAHREMCRLVHGDPPSDAHVAAHKCGNGHLGCVHPKHLRWATPAENAAEYVEHRRERQAIDQIDKKLSAVDVIAIRAAWPQETQTQLAERFGVCQATIWKIVHKRIWAWV